jgi:hypothetical protein
MPKLSAVLSDADFQTADDSLKTFYVQNTETTDWWLDVDEPAKLDVAGQTAFQNLKSKLDGAFKERDAANKLAKAYKDLGTPEEIKAAKEANQPENVTKLVSDYEEKIENLKKSFEEPIAHATEKVKKYETQIQQSLSQSAIAKLRNQYDLNETADYVLKDFIKVVPKEEGSDEFAVKVFENGSPALVAGREMTTDELIKGFQENKKFPAMFNAGTGGGSGGSARQTAPGGKTVSVSRAAVKADINVYRAAQEQAAKVGGEVVLTD